MQAHESNGFDDARLELAVIAALEGRGALSADEHRQLAEIDDRTVEELEFAAGAVFAALAHRAGMSLPLEGSIHRLEEALTARAVRSNSTTGAGPSAHRANGARSSSHERPAREPSPSGGAPSPSPSLASPLLALSGWAAAAALLATLVMSYTRIGSLEQQLGLGDPSKRLAELLEVAPDTQVLAWATEGVGGDVTWSDRRNEGYMRIGGLEANDPRQSQYQLWIFRGTDPAAEPHPVDGGVFDVRSDGDVVVPIDAKIDVGRAGLFAVTVEKPGGVVVSAREKIVAVASR